MRLAKGIPWALPVCLAVDHEPQGDEVTLTARTIVSIAEAIDVRREAGSIVKSLPLVG